MKNGFEASVPARKPKTQIGRVLTELTSQSALPAGLASEDDVPPDFVLANGEAAVAGTRVETPSPARQPDVAEPPTSAPPQIALHQPSAAPVSNDWERLVALRERLAAAAQPRSIAAEPQHTAAAVRKVIDDLRSRLEAALRDRAELTSTLESTRAALTRVETELEHERNIRSHIEAQADEREKVAIQAVAEAEALAAERDLVLRELSERRRLENEQNALLAEAEAALNRHRAANEKAAREVAELHDLRSAEVADLETRLEAEVTERTRLETRCRELEAQVARLTETAQALESIKEMVIPAGFKN